MSASSDINVDKHAEFFVELVEGVRIYTATSNVPPPPPYVRHAASPQLLSSSGANKCEKFRGTDGRGETRRAEMRGPKGRERGGVLEEGQPAPSPPARGLGSAVSSPSGFWGGAPDKIEFDAF